ncbi:hypothetical protein [Arenimonas aestuarii]
MRELLQAELLRFRTWAIAAAIVHLAVLGFFARLVDPLQQPDFVHAIVAGLYFVLGLLLGLYQMGSYRRPNAWLNLLHRPLPPGRIVAALSSAAGALLCLAVLLPLLLLVLGQWAWTARVVDLRHAALPLAAGLIAMGGYLAGAIAMLSTRRVAAFALVPPALWFASQASGVWALAVQVLVLAWLAAWLRVVFKPDLTAPPRTAAGQGLAAVPLAFGAYVLLVLASLGYQLGWMVLGNHPLNGTPPAGGYVEASRADAGELLLAGLAGSEHAQAPLWRQQVPLSRLGSLSPEFTAFPLVHALTNPVLAEFDDADNRRRYTFSHDAGRFLGVNPVNREREGVLGVGETQQRFPSPPLLVGDGLMATAHALYRYDNDRQQIDVVLELPATETLAAPPAVAGESLAVLSDQALYLYDARAFRTGTAALAPRQRLPLSLDGARLARIDLMELIDGELVSITVGRGSIDGTGEAWQAVWHWPAEGSPQEVARRDLAPDFPQLLRHYEWWVSPTLSRARQALVQLFATANPLQAGGPGPRPAAAWLAAGLAALVAAIGSWAWGRRQALGRRARVIWVLVCLLIGLPGLLAQWLLYPRRDHA